MTEIRASDELRAVGLKARSTALLYGPPGTGKTTLAHHLAARLGLPLVALQTERIHERWLGATGENLGEVFDALALLEDDCVVLFDEADAMMSKRTTRGASAGDKDYNQQMSVMLRRIESFSGIALAATNLAEDIDPAMWRRFGLQICVALPGDDERFAILKRYAAPFEFRDQDLDLLVDLTGGASPALLRGVMEGMKRALVLGPKLRRDTSMPAAVFRQIISAVAPPPDISAPQLWSVKSACDELIALKWPPERGDQN
jgi:SpoVK/Ycf46/Vps4 family AAA+-type ATPase